MYPLINATAINAPDGEAAAPGIGNARPLVFGDWVAVADESIRNAELYPPGLSLVRTDWFGIEAQQPSPSVTVRMSGSRPLALGDTIATASGRELEVGGAHAMGLGGTVAGQAAFLGGAACLAVGVTEAVQVARIQPSHPLRLGDTSAVAQIDVPGLSLVRAGRVSFSQSGSEATIVGGYALQCGATSSTQAAFIHQAVALRMGQTYITKEAAC